MKFPLEVLEKDENKEKLLEILKYKICSNCLGRQFGQLGHGLTNAERGEILRKFASELTKSELKEPTTCELCNNFFKDKINNLAKNIVKKMKGLEFATFLVGTIIQSELARKQDALWEKIGIEYVESLKSEINRELGKRIEKLTNKKFDLKSPDVTIIVDLNTDSIRTQIKSLYVFGKYQKLARGIPQTKWVCSKCKGKGCTFCEGKGKLYPTSIQEIIENPLLKATKSKKTSFHGAGREDIDARNLDWRPFVIELTKPLKRKFNLKKIEKKIDSNKKIKVKGLKIAENGKELIRKLKTDRADKTYLIDAVFANKIDKKLLKNLKNLVKEPILQKTPLRVVHRRANKIRKRHVKKISYKVIGSKRMQFKVRAEAGLYIKELVTGDEGRTKPNISELLNNKVKKLTLDVIKIHGV